MPCGRSAGSSIFWGEAGQLYPQSILRWPLPLRSKSRGRREPGPYVASGSPARVARRVGHIVLPAHRRQFSTRRFTQPQLLAILGLRCSEDGTFRDAEVRLAEHRERRAALGWTCVPDDTALEHRPVIKGSAQTRPAHCIGVSSRPPSQCKPLTCTTCAGEERTGSRELPFALM
jgi:hypothetical protein